MAFCGFLWPPRAWDSRRGDSAKMFICSACMSPYVLPCKRVLSEDAWHVHHWLEGPFYLNFVHVFGHFQNFVLSAPKKLSFLGFLCCVHVNMLEFQDCCAALCLTMLKFPGFLRWLRLYMLDFPGFLLCLHLSMPRFPGFLCCPPKNAQISRISVLSAPKHAWFSRIFAVLAPGERKPQPVRNFTVRN